MTLKRLSTALLLAVVTAGTLAVTAAPAGALTSEENQFVSLHNQARTSRGIRALTVYSDLVTVARRHSQEMASKGTIYHNSNLPNEVSGWRALGENVGMGPNVNDLFQAFMNSPDHRSNILDTDYNQFGVGVVISSDKTIYVTVVFAQRTSSSSTTTTTKPTTSTTTSKSTTTRRTAPRATTTTTRAPAPSARPAAAKPAAPKPAPKPAAPAVQRTVNMLQMLIAMDAAVVNPATGEALGR